MQEEVESRTVNLAISTVVLLTVNMLEARQKKAVVR